MTELGIQMSSDFTNLVNSNVINSSTNWGTGIILQDPISQKILLAERIDTHNYGTPGGKVELYETPFQGVIRECKEESNIDVIDMICYGVNFHSSPSGKDWVSFLFYSNKFDASEIINQKTEMKEWNWYDVDTAFQMDLFPPSRDGLVQAKELGLLDNSADSSHYIPFINCPKSASTASIGNPCQYSIIQNDPLCVPMLKSPWIVWD